MNKAYIEEKKRLLRDFNVYRFCSQEEIQRLENASSEIRADVIFKELFLNHIDEAAECAINAEEIYEADCVSLNDSIRSTNITNKVANALIRAKIYTIQDFVTYVKKYGWGNIKNFGNASAMTIFRYLNPNRDIAKVKKIVSKSKEVK